MSKVQKFIERVAKAKDPKNPFPADRVFPSVEEMFLFEEEFRELLEGLSETIDAQQQEIERLSRQIRSMNV